MESSSIPWEDLTTALAFGAGTAAVLHMGGINIVGPPLVGILGQNGAVLGSSALIVGAAFLAYKMWWET